MVSPQIVTKTCRLCRRELFLCEFHLVRPGAYSSRCKRCHGLAIRECAVCKRLFVGKPGRKACSIACRQILRPVTFLFCQHCGQQFGPVNHLGQRFCSKACAYAAAATGRKTIRKTSTKARSAQSLLRYHVQAGHILRLTECEECGAVDRAIEGAHFDYDEPLRVRWLCVSCHRRWDKREPKHATFVVDVPRKLEHE